MALSDATSGSAAELLQQVRNHLAGRNPAAAYALLQIAVVHHEDDPFLISYYGYLRAARDGSFKSGIEDCSRALWLYQRRLLRGVGGDDERLKAVLYLNLGRANLAAGKRKDAYDALAKGMLLDLGNHEILEELGRMGIRKRKPVPFLGRSNPLNNFIGRMLRKPEDLPPPRI